MRKKWLGVALMVFAFASILFFVLNRGPAEPVYKGKRISLWIEPLRNTDTQEREKASKDEEEAVLAIGTNGIPYYLKCLQYRDSPLRIRILDGLRSFGANYNMHSISRFAFLHSASTKCSFACDALYILQSDPKCDAVMHKFGVKGSLKMAEENQTNIYLKDYLERLRLKIIESEKNPGQQIKLN